MRKQEVLEVARRCVAAVCRLALGVAMVVVALVLGVSVAKGVHSLVDSTAGAEWVTTAAIAMAGGWIVVLVQALPTFAEGLMEFSRSLLDRSWHRFWTACWGVGKSLFVPVALVVFAATYVAVEPARPALDQVRKELAFLRDQHVELEANVLAGIGEAMAQHGYTTKRAELLDSLEQESRFHFARFPVLFEAAQLAPGIDPAAEANKVAFRAGVALDEPAKQFIAQLVEALGPCGRERRVELVVEGYASSEPFRDTDVRRSDELNLLVANERGLTVAAAIRDRIREKEWSGRFEIQPREYTSLEEMRQFRQFDDRARGAAIGAGRYPQDLLTRAAHIRIADAGDCATDT